MTMASSNIRRSCFFPNLLLSCLNFVLFVLSLLSVAPIILLRNPPTSLGLSFLAVSLISLLSSFTGFFSHITYFCFITRVSLLISSLIGQLLAVLALFTKEKLSLSLLKSSRDPREAKVLVRLECGVFMAMLPIQIMVLVLTCVLHCYWVREYEGFEAEKEAATARKRNRRVATVQEESIADAKAKEFNEKVKSKNVQWMKTDFEG